MEAAQDLSYTTTIKLLLLISNGGCPKKVVNLKVKPKVFKSPLVYILLKHG